MIAKAILCSTLLIFLCPLSFSSSVAGQSQLVNIKNVLHNEVSRQGMSSCFTDSDCGGAQQCVAKKQAEPGLEPCPSKDSVCRCMPLIPCNSTADCEREEVCSQGLDTKVCIHEELNTLAVYDRGIDETPSFLQSSVRKLNFEPCSQNAECTAPRICIRTEDRTLVPCDGNNDCLCFKRDVQCQSTADCDDGEICRGVGQSFVCVSSILPGVQNNFERCLASDDCAGSRECLTVVGGSLVRCITGEFCLCLKESISCSASEMCDRGETCQQGSSGGGLCASTNVDVGPEVEPANTMPSSSPRASDELPPDQDSSETPVTPPSTESPSPTPADSRPNPDSRPDPDSNPDLVPAGNPVTPQTSQSPPALPTPNTATRSPSPSVGSNIGTDQSSGDCSDNGDCNISQECREDSVGIGRCVRREENICISVHHLSHLHGDDLRYSTHRLARVLCDKHNSCATAGHIVIYEAVPMMMSSYCKTVRCVQKIMHVNSVRYKRRSVVQSNSKGLTFTAFAARYNTVLEEKLLGMAIRLGL